MTRRAHAWVLAALVAALLALHVDTWNKGQVDPLVLGWMPVDLAYHVGWVLAATAVIFYMTGRVWPEDPAERRGARGEEGA
ncbi:MAG: DUF3311 domain-containing protein [Myxococcales bacterium]|nr:DUF3311 domain-containing protein [Myxococcales bacterium]